METRRQDRDILSHQFRGQQGGGTSTHVAPWCERDLDFVKIKNIKKAKSFIWMFLKKQSTQKISNQNMKSKERDKSILEYVQCMHNNVHAYKVPGF